MANVPKTQTGDPCCL